LYGNLTEDEILLRERFDDLKKKYPDTFDVVYFVDKKTKATKDDVLKTGFITKEAIQKHLPGPDLGGKIKVFVCGAFFSLWFSDMVRPVFNLICGIAVVSRQALLDK